MDMLDKKIQCLIVDDDVASRAYYQAILKKSFPTVCHVIETGSAIDAIEKLGKEKIDCILLDYRLPDMNGVDLLKIIKKMCGKFMPIIMLTGEGSEGVAVEVMKEGVMDYIVKSKIDPPFFVKTIENAIRQAELKRVIYEQKKKLRSRAYYDDLTGLMNRKAFENTLVYILSDARRFYYTVAVLLIELDNFATINDSFGHMAGNEVLIEITNRLQSLLSKEVILARFGVDEFAVVLTGKNVADDAVGVSKNVIEKISQPYPLVLDQTYVKASIGIACYPGSGENVTDLIDSATAALSRAKVLGK